MQSFLNDLDSALPQLLHPHALRVYENPDSIDDFHVVVLYNNSPLFIDAYFRRIFNIGHVREATTSVPNNSELLYRFSDKHIEFPLTDDHVQYIKQVTKNKTLNDKKSIFCIKGIPSGSQHLQNQLKNVIEKSTNTVFVIQAENRTDISPALSTMSIAIPLHFRFDQVFDYYNSNFKIFGHTEPLSIDVVRSIYDSSNPDMLSMFMRLAHKIQKTRLEASVDAFVEACDGDTDPLSTITRCRELAYKLFHMNYPLCSLAKYLYSILPSHILTDFSFISASADHLCMTTKKDILTYERFLIELAELMKIPAPPKKMLKKVVMKKKQAAS